MAQLWQALIDNSGAVVAVFTIVLAVTTIIYVVVTAKLLKQSRNALLVDMVLRAVELIRGGIKTKKEGGVETDSLMGGWVSGYLKVFMEIDKKMGLDIEKLFRAGLETVSEEWGEGVEEAERQIEKWKKKIKEGEKKIKELQKKLEEEKQDMRHPKNK